MLNTTDIVRNKMSKKKQSACCTGSFVVSCIFHVEFYVNHAAAAAAAAGLQFDNSQKKVILPCISGRRAL
jgi:hypothetical protein